MDTNIFKFYEAFKNHQFTEDEMKDVVEGIKAILKDENRENATKKDIEQLLNTLEKRFDKIDKDSDRINDRIDRVYDRYHQIVIWVVSTGIAVTGLVIAGIRYL